MIEAKIMSVNEAGINVDAISENALKVVSELQKAGYEAYLVGGCVRDLMLDMKPKDFDVSTDAKPDQIKKLFKNSRIIGRRFKLVHVRFGYEVIEVATFRANPNDRESVSTNEMSEGDQGQLLRDNVFGTLEEDVMRRDFRANALYLDPVSGEVLDFVGGREDILEKKLISIGEPIQRFREDPVRMLRVVRFAAKLSFTMEPEAKQMIEDEGKLLAHVSPARLFEEVLKLFHGGAAYDTYLMLREYGLFKYLFPFTDQGILHDVDGMPERALQNTDKRIKQGKPVIPAFLFACMMWDPVKADAQILMADGTPESQAWRIAMSDGLRDQNQYVAVPRRLAEIILDIWNIHFRLVKRNPRMVKACLNNRRFRAAYDFLLLRVALHEVDESIGDWWTRIQEVDGAGREEMIEELNAEYRSKREAMQGRETDGNSINYNSLDYAGGGNSSGANRSRPGGPAQKSGGKPKPRGRNARGGRGSKKTSTRNRQRNSRAVGDADSIGNTIGGNEINGNSRGGANSANNHRGPKKSNRRGRSKNATGRGRNSTGSGRGGQRSERANDAYYSDAQPKDSYGNYQSTNSSSGTKKKVKVRHKRRIPGIDPDEKPIF